MTFLDHLVELRKTLIFCICSILIAIIPCGIYWENIFIFLANNPLILADPMPRLIYTAPAETVMLSLKIAFVSGTVLASPIVFWRIWRFIAPGLFTKEKKIILPVVALSTICFLFGFVFCFYLFPYVFQFLTSFAGNTIEPMYKIDEYLSFVLNMSFAFGIIFELPILTFLLTKMSIIDHHFLLKYFRYIIVGIFIIAAIITPPDLFSQIIVACPLLILYSISILVAYCVKRKKDNGKEDSSLHSI